MNFFFKSKKEFFLDFKISDPKTNRRTNKLKAVGSSADITKEKHKKCMKYYIFELQGKVSVKVRLIIAVLYKTISSCEMKRKALLSLNWISIERKIHFKPVTVTPAHTQGPVICCVWNAPNCKLSTLQKILENFFVTKVLMIILTKQQKTTRDHATLIDHLSFSFCSILFFRYFFRFPLQCATG